MRNYFVTTYGCQANTADSEKIAGMLEVLGMTSVEDFLGADLIVINTCSVRQASEDKVYGLATKILQAKRLKPGAKVVLTGCLVGSATSDRARLSLEVLQRKMPWVDHYLNTNDLIHLPAYLLATGLADEWAVKVLVGKNWNAKVGEHDGTAYIDISQGCDNFCTFCVVPYSRGKEISRSKEEILREIDYAVNLGIREVMLLGQNVNSWGLTPERKLTSRRHLGELPFAGLLRKVHSLEGVKKIKFLTSNPFDFSADLVEALKLPKIERFLHLPVQSGDNEILRRMGRRHSREDYLELVGEIRQAVPQMRLGTDIIVGFPGETDSQLEQTVDLLRHVRFDVVYIALYSPRPGTASSRLYGDDIPLAEKRRRHAYLTQVWKSTRNE